MASDTPRDKVALVANTSWYLFNFRLSLMNALREMGYDVIAIAPKDAYSQKLIDARFSYRHISLYNASLNPVREALSVFSLKRALRKERVNVVLSFTPKGNIYSGLAIADNSVTFIPNVSGLGHAFSKRSPIQWLSRRLLRHCFARADHVLFQNNEDLHLMVEGGLVNSKKTGRIPGSGVDLVRFTPQDNSVPDGHAPLYFLFIGRLLWEKGIGQFVEAARIARKHNPRLRFGVLGPRDKRGPGGRENLIDRWVEDNIIEYHGVSDDVRPYIAAASCVVLPSYYREGIPRSLLEAAAMGKPTITTDTAGCRDAVIDGHTGYLCRPKDVNDLVGAIQRFASLPPEEAQRMGQLGRKRMEREFSERIVIDRYLTLLRHPPL